MMTTTPELMAALKITDLPGSRTPGLQTSNISCRSTLTWLRGEGGVRGGRGPPGRPEGPPGAAGAGGADPASSPVRAAWPRAAHS